MEEEAHTRGRLRIHCLRKPRGITPEQTSETLPKLAKKKGTGMIVFGESTAHYVCKDRAEPSYHTSSNGVMVINETTFVRRHEELVRVLQDIRAARFENNDPPLTFVWLGPMRTTIKVKLRSLIPPPWPPPLAPATYSSTPAFIRATRVKQRS